MQLFLLETRHGLIPLIENRKDKHNYMKWSEFKSYLNGVEFMKILKNHIDHSKEFLEKSGG